MWVGAILKAKGSRVVGTTPDTSIAEVSRLLSAERIGAVLVRDENGAIEGILSERDIVRTLAREGAATLDLPAKQLMTRAVVTCSPEDTVAQVMEMMTHHRIRHLPVLQQGRLVGMVSIGDVVKARIGEQEEEVEGLRAFVAGNS